MEDKSLKTPRKKPRQERSFVLVDSILTASTRILEKFGWSGFSTNKVADVAGVSIGSLYQYFPNKEALIGKLIEKHAFHHVKVVEKALKENSQKPLNELTEILIRTVLGEIIENRKLIKLITSKTFSVERLETIIRARKELIRIISELLSKSEYGLRLGESESELKAYVIANSLGGVVEAILFDEDKDREFYEKLADESVAKVNAYVEKSRS